ncbi:FAD-binding protein [Chloroflexota bacterium]
MIQAASGNIDITKADIIVAVGRGIRNKTNIRLVEDLADALGGVIACTRPLADLEWLPPEIHVGMSGKTIAPKVYMASPQKAPDGVLIGSP